MSIYANKTDQQIMHLHQDLPAYTVNLAAYTVSFVLAVVVFFGQKGHNLFRSKQNVHRRHLWIVLLNVALFAFYRMISSALRGAHKVIRFARSSDTYQKSNGMGELSVVFMVMGLPLFVFMFSNLISLWTTIVEKSYIGSRKLIIVLRVAVAIITVLTFIDGIVASLGLCLNSLHPLVEPVIVRYICGPVFGLLVLSLNIIIIIVGIFLIKGVREAFADQQQSKTKAKSTKKMEYQLLIIYKVSIGCVLFLVAVNIQLVGVVLTAVLTKSEIYPALLLLGVPENVTMLMIIFSFWPFGCARPVSSRKATSGEQGNKEFSSARAPTSKAQQFLRPIEMNHFEDDETSSDLVSVVESRETPASTGKTETQTQSQTVAVIESATAPHEHLHQTPEETAGAETRPPSQDV